MSVCLLSVYVCLSVVCLSVVCLSVVRLCLWLVNILGPLLIIGRCHRVLSRRAEWLLCIALRPAAILQGELTYNKH